MFTIRCSASLHLFEITRCSPPGLLFAVSGSPPPRTITFKPVCSTRIYIVIFLPHLPLRWAHPSRLYFILITVSFDFLAFESSLRSARLMPPFSGWRLSLAPPRSRGYFGLGWAPMQFHFFASARCMERPLRAPPPSFSSLSSPVFGPPLTTFLWHLLPRSLAFRRPLVSGINHFKRRPPSFAYVVPT